MMNVAVKAFLTYAAISMFAGFVLMMLTMGHIISFNAVPIGVITVLWIGPLMLAGAIALPYGLWVMWKGE